MPTILATSPKQTSSKAPSKPKEGFHARVSRLPLAEVHARVAAAPLAPGRCIRIGSDDLARTEGSQAPATATGRRPSLGLGPRRFAALFASSLSPWKVKNNEISSASGSQGPGTRRVQDCRAAAKPRAPCKASDEVSTSAPDRPRPSYLPDLAGEPRATSAGLHLDAARP